MLGLFNNRKKTGRLSFSSEFVQTPPVIQEVVPQLPPTPRQVQPFNPPEYYDILEVPVTIQVKGMMTPERFKEVEKFVNEQIKKLKFDSISKGFKIKHLLRWKRSSPFVDNVGGK